MINYQGKLRIKSLLKHRTKIGYWYMSSTSNSMPRVWIDKLLNAYKKETSSNDHK